MNKVLDRGDRLDRLEGRAGEREGCVAWLERGYLELRRG